MTESLPNYPITSSMTNEEANQAARLVGAIQELTAMLSDRLWNEPEYDGVKDRFKLLAMIDASHAAARELTDLIH